jgi:hypothetical protein
VGVRHHLKGQCHEILDFWFFSWISFPQAPEYTIKAVSNLFWHYSHYLPPVSLIPVVHLDLWISPRILEKIRKNPNDFQELRGRWFMKKTWSNKARDTVPFNFWANISAHISSWRAHSVHRTSSWCKRSVHSSACFEGTFSNFEFLLLFWWVCSGYASVPDTYAKRTHQFLKGTLRVRTSSRRICLACFEGTVVSAPISSWQVCPVHAPGPDAYAQRTHQFLMCMFSACISSW